MMINSILCNKNYRVILIAEDHCPLIDNRLPKAPLINLLVYYIYYFKTLPKIKKNIYQNKTKF